MSEITLFDKGTGRITAHWSAGEDGWVEANDTTSVGAVSGLHDSDEYYVSSGTVTARPASPITLDGTTLKDVPAGAIINIDGTEEVVETAEDVELVFPLSGTYEVRVKHFPYLDFVAEVTV